jgi:S1-C subfamily serine protease
MRGEDISDYIDMLDLKDTLAPGDIIEVEVFRAGEYLSLDLEVSEETGSEPAVD